MKHPKCCEIFDGKFGVAENVLITFSDGRNELFYHFGMVRLLKPLELLKTQKV